MNDLVSIILPVYNIEKYIRETLDCVLSQTFQNWELEITDDCSTDGTAEIIKEYLQPIVTQYLVCNKSEIWP